MCTSQFCRRCETLQVLVPPRTDQCSGGQLDARDTGDSAQRDLRMNGLMVGLWLPPLGSTVTNTASISVNCLGSSNRITQRRLVSLSIYRMPRFIGEAGSP